MSGIQSHQLVTKDLVNHLHHKRGVAFDELSKMFGINENKLFRVFKDNNISINFTKEKAIVAIPKKPETKNSLSKKSWLEKCFVQNSMSMGELAKMTGVSRPAVRYWLKKHDLLTSKKHRKTKTRKLNLRGRALKKYKLDS